jgi:DNA-binding GntR family transcriptional regulator
MIQSQRVNRKLFEPSYAQLVRIIQEQIASGELRPGDQLPSESQLCRFHRISPMTARRAINILAEQGIVFSEQGRGTFVKTLQFWEASFQLGALRELFANEKETRVKILEARIVPSDEKLAKKFSIKTGQKCLYIRRLITLAGNPYLYHTEYLVYDPSRPIIESEMEVTSLKGLFQGVNNRSLKKSSLTIETVVLKGDEARLLNSKESSPAFLLEHVFYDFEDHPVSWGWFVCPGDRLRFTTSIGAQNGDGPR